MSRWIDQYITEGDRTRFFDRTANLKIELFRLGRAIKIANEEIADPQPEALKNAAEWLPSAKAKEETLSLPVLEALKLPFREPPTLDPEESRIVQHALGVMEESEAELLELCDRATQLRHEVESTVQWFRTQKTKSKKPRPRARNDAIKPGFVALAKRLVRVAGDDNTDEDLWARTEHYVKGTTGFQERGAEWKVFRDGEELVQLWRQHKRQTIGKRGFFRYLSEARKAYTSRS
ncbi:MAG: hypothetical protein HZB55_23710 [Deltaproteobacteria bacterium]|nr:hypothetical protein [Deltaproteobacteria bacterium]